MLYQKHGKILFKIILAIMANLKLERRNNYEGPE